MNRYTELLTITLPYSPELAAIAAKVGKAFDPDTAGEYSFHRQVASHDGETPIYADTLVCRVGCLASFKEQAFAMMGSAPFLHAACAQDYATRWPDLTPPTLAECEAFVNAVVLE